MVLQERTQWLKHPDILDILGMPIGPEGIFGSTLESMQQRCETRKKRTKRSGFVFHEKQLLHSCETQDIPACVHPRTQYKIPNRAKAAPIPVHLDQPGLFVQPSSCFSTRPGGERDEPGSLRPPGDVAGCSPSPSSTGVLFQRAHGGSQS